MLLDFAGTLMKTVCSNLESSPVVVIVLWTQLGKLSMQVLRAMVQTLTACGQVKQQLRIDGKTACSRVRHESLHPWPLVWSAPVFCQQSGLRRLH